MTHEPHPTQRRFLALTCFEALYGGAAGGGKTDALLMAAAQYLHVPGYAALLLRRTYADLSLPNALMDRAKQWWLGREGVRWQDTEKRFVFPSGASITFGYLDNANDKFRYQGAEIQFVGLDELTQFPEQWYRYLLSRLRRRIGVDVPLRARAASNPGGIGHDWVRRRFVETDGRTQFHTEFVPARLEDNPSLDREEYSRTLERLDPVLRRQLREGEWIADGGGLVYGAFDEKLNLIDKAPELSQVILGLDFGIVDDNAATILGWRDNDPHVYVLSSYRRRGDVQDMADEVAALCERYSFAQIVGDTGGLGKAFVEELQGRRHIPVDAADKTNKLGYVRLLNGDLARQRVLVVKDTCQDLINEWRELAWNETRTKEAEGFANHASDSCLYAWRACNAFLEKPKDEAPVYGTPEFFAAEERKQLERMEKSLRERLGEDQ